MKLRIAVADDEPDMQEYFAKILPRLGHHVVAVATNGRELLEACRQHLPDLVISDIKMPIMDGIEAAVELYRSQPIPVILVSAYQNPELVRRAQADHVMAYLVKPIKQAELPPVIGLAIHRFHELKAAKQESDDLRRQLDERKTIERAKGVLMKRANLNEPDAHRRLQKLASDSNQKLIVVARNILSIEQAYQKTHAQQAAN
jgi:response regulator NasT